MGIFASDSFTDSDGTTLQAHTGELGSPWSKLASSDLTIVSNKITPPYPLGVYFPSASPSAADQTVDLDLSLSSSAGSWQVRLYSRFDYAANTGYMAIISHAGNASLYKYVSGVPTLLGSASGAYSAPGSFTVRLDVKDASKRVLIGGTAIITSTDNAITAVGKCGFGAYNLSGAYLSVDNFSAADVVIETTSFDTRVAVTAPFSADFDTELFVFETLPCMVHGVAGVVSFGNAPARPLMSERHLQAAAVSAAGVRRAASIDANAREIRVNWRGMSSTDFAALEAFLLDLSGDLFLFAGVDGVVRTVLQVGELGSRNKTPDRLDVTLELLEILP